MTTGYWTESVTVSHTVKASTALWTGVVDPNLTGE
jgi:hypothetical protein